MGALHAHFWTVGTALRDLAMPPVGPESTSFAVSVPDTRFGAVRLSGRLNELAESSSLVVIIHGLGGSAESSCCIRAARAAEQAGCSSLRLSLRGADLSGEDIYHAGMTADIEAALGSHRLAHYRDILLLGYSLGGHIALRAALDKVDTRLRAVAAISAPLDLYEAAIQLDHPSRAIYRQAIFSIARASYAAAARRGRAPAPLRAIRRVRHVCEWNELTIVPRFGFRNERDYCERASAGPLLCRLDIPSLLVAGRRDPVVPSSAWLPSIADASGALEIRWLDSGGHIFFPGDTDLGMSAPLGLEPQVFGWFGRHVRLENGCGPSLHLGAEERQPEREVALYGCER